MLVRTGGHNPADACSIPLRIARKGTTHRPKGHTTENDNGNSNQHPHRSNHPEHRAG